MSIFLVVGIAGIIMLGVVLPAHATESRVTVDRDAAAPGGSVVVTVERFASGGEIEILVDLPGGTQVHGLEVADGAGSARYTVEIPENTRDGLAVATVIGLDGDGSPMARSVTWQIDSSLRNRAEPLSRLRLLGAIGFLLAAIGLIAGPRRIVRLKSQIPLSKRT